MNKTGDLNSSYIIGDPKCAYITGDIYVCVCVCVFLIALIIVYVISVVRILLMISVARIP